MFNLLRFYMYCNFINYNNVKVLFGHYNPEFTISWVIISWITTMLSIMPFFSKILIIQHQINSKSILWQQVVCKWCKTSEASLIPNRNTIKLFQNCLPVWLTSSIHQQLSVLLDPTTHHTWHCYPMGHWMAGAEVKCLSTTPIKTILSEAMKLQM